MKGGEHKKTMKDALVVEIRECQNSREGDLRGLLCSFSFRAWVTEPVAESGHVAFVTWPSRSDNFIGYYEGEESSHVLMLRLTPSIGLRTSKLKRPLARLEVTFSWIAEQDGYMKSREIKTTGLGVNQHKARYEIELVNTKALLKWIGYREALAIPQRCGS
jgi:hypothetical protein